MLRPALPRTRSWPKHQAPIWAELRGQLAMSCRAPVLAQWEEVLSHSHGAGRPVRWLVTITGESLGSSVASATNSNASSTEPTTAKKARTGIGAFRLHGPYAF